MSRSGLVAVLKGRVRKLFEEVELIHKKKGEVLG